jgi:hypothetical protein
MSPFIVIDLIAFISIVVTWAFMPGRAGVK